MHCLSSMQSQYHAHLPTCHSKLSAEGSTSVEASLGGSCSSSACRAPAAQLPMLTGMLRTAAAELTTHSFSVAASCLSSREGGVTHLGMDGSCQGGGLTWAPLLVQSLSAQAASAGDSTRGVAMLMTWAAAALALRAGQQLGNL